MLKKLLFILFLTGSSLISHASINKELSLDLITFINDRKLSEEEVQERGLDVLVAKLLETANQEVLKKMARSSIFETNYGFRWKMINTISGEIVIIKVDKDFKLIELKSKGLY
ncbi:hypothetical protein NBT05_15350 [Aquimarina sp. ERC-38]|uniref:hypothetical protein n=1 Tax=Aquimarina sp. ERC-38 TaxID=2949996 RepID=UPI0022468FA2|nr:hypothetical protein [Aquimarina sp. ERC-38]UZO80318.1 hypothetical protein NBT05_15350 [Aquimarina sp. ERC-38]